MADEQVEQSPQQQEAEKKVNVAPEVVTADPQEDEKNAKLVADVIPKIEKYGFDSYTQFLNRIGSDSQFAAQVVTDLLTDNPDAGIHPRVVAGEAFSPQEIKPDGKPRNLTGRMNHSVDTPTRIVPDAA